MSLPSPTLSYIGACDTSTGTDGNVMFNILFDPSITLLMFEYVIQPTSSFGTTDNVISGFIHTDTCTQSGINNQYVLPIPAQDVATSTTSSNVVRVRVYDANTGEATLWSNVMDMYFPPSQPVILHAYYEGKAENAYDDGLYVLFTDSINPFQAIVSYYYTDSYGNTQWAVTSPSSLTPFTYESTPGVTEQGKYLFIPLGNDVDYNSSIYVAAHSAYSWTVSGVDYYAVSEVTPTFVADAAEYASPTLDPVVYNVYSDPTDQSVSLSWVPPLPSSNPLDLIIVDSYNVKVNYQVGSTTYTTIIPVDASSTNLVYPLPDTTCGISYNFSVCAVSSSGQETAYSNVEQLLVYKYPTAPTNLDIAYAFFEDGTTNKIDMLFSFKNPLSNGCGSSPFLEYVIKDGNANIVKLPTVVPYVAGTEPYVVRLDGLDSSATTLVVEVYMKTTDTNSSNILSGPKTSQTHTITGVPFIDQVSVDMYNSLTFRVQTATFLNLINNVVCIGNSSLPTVVNWTSAVTGANVISLVPDSNGVWVYIVEVQLPGTFNHVVVNASNIAGIGHDSQAI